MKTIYFLQCIWIETAYSLQCIWNKQLIYVSVSRIKLICNENYL